MCRGRRTLAEFRAWSGDDGLADLAFRDCASLAACEVQSSARRRRVFCAGFSGSLHLAIRDL